MLKLNTTWLGQIIVYEQDFRVNGHNINDTSQNSPTVCMSHVTVICAENIMHVRCTVSKQWPGQNIQGKCYRSKVNS